MNTAELINHVLESQRTQLAQRATHTEAIGRIRDEIGTNAATVAQQDQLRAAAAAIQTIDAELRGLTEREQQLRTEAEADARAAALRTQLEPEQTTQRADGDGTRSATVVTREERTYSKIKNLRGENSFFHDAWENTRGNWAARERLERHGREALAEGEMTQRALATGGLGGLVVPQYLVDAAALVIRAGRPLANAVLHKDLPPQGMTLVVPRGTTGAAVAAQASENTAVQNTDEAWANLNIPVVTIAGQEDVSRQSIERGTPGLDEMIYTDLAGAYHAELDRQVATGSGAAGQMLGILNTAGIYAATAFGAAPTAANFYSKVAGAVAGLAGVGAGIAPGIVFMHPRRWGWLTAQVDSTGRPLVVPAAQSPYNAHGINGDPGSYGGDGNPLDISAYTVVGSIQGLPVVTDANIPAAVGTNSEDVALVFDPKHAWLWEDGDRMPRQLRFEQTLGNQLTVKIVVYNYVAFTAARYPVAFGKVGGLDATAGQGLVNPTF